MNNLHKPLSEEQKQKLAEQGISIFSNDHDRYQAIRTPQGSILG